MSIDAMKQALDALEHEAQKGNDDAYRVERDALRAAIEQANAGETSDGYHSFNELYAFRKAYNAALFNELAANGKCSVHKSWRHYDGELCFGGGWFIVVAMLPSGQISNHYEAKDWDLFKVPATEKAMFPFDGHTGADVVARLSSYAPAHIPIEQAQEPMSIIQQLWDIIDDIDTYTDMAKADDKLYRLLVERRQKDRWKTGITTDGQTLNVPFYTAPRQWQGLTDEEIAGVRHLYDGTAGWTIERFARAIEAKLREKNT